MLSTTGTLASTVGADNPFRYRGYYYDAETGLYYLNQLYYNTEWKRFINADDFMGVAGELLTHNVFAYCANNPVSKVDPSGRFFGALLRVIKDACDGNGGGVLGAIVSTVIVVGAVVAVAALTATTAGAGLGLVPALLVGYAAGGVASVADQVVEDSVNGNEITIDTDRCRQD